MKSQSQILEEFIAALLATKVRYLIGGSVASSSIGIPRATLDTDVLVELGGPQLLRLATQLGDQWYSMLSLPEAPSPKTAHSM